MSNIQAEFEKVREEFKLYAKQGDFAKALSLVTNPQLKKTLKHEFVNKRLIWLENMPPLPELTFDLYSMDIDSIRILQEYIQKHKPKMIVECGGGASSIILSLTIKKIQESDALYSPQYISIESDNQYYQMYSDLALKYNLEDILHYEYSPLVACTISERVSKFYDLASIITKHNVENIDLLIVDGPIGHMQELARRPGYYIAKPYLAESFGIFLDDTDRDDEKAIIKEWAGDIVNSVIVWYESIAQVCNF